MAQSKLTIIVVPRERFTGSRRSLASIYGNTRMKFELIYVDGGSPVRVHRYLKLESQRRGFRLIRTDHYLTPNEARNLAFKSVDSEYVVFVDNDVVVEPGWLENLVACAEETAAWVVGPTYLIGEPKDQIVHLTGGDARFAERDGERHFIESHRNATRHLSEVKDSLRRTTCDFVEFHCMLIRSDVLRRLGGLDDALLSSPEHIDICLQVWAAGGQVYFEPTSIVTYVPRYLMPPSDLRFFLRRWSDEWNRASLRHFQLKYGLRDNDRFLTMHYGWLTGHRRWPVKLFTKPMRMVFGNFLSDFLERRLDSLLFALTPKDQPRALETERFPWALDPTSRPETPA